VADHEHRTRTPSRKRPFDLRATALFFALVAVVLCIVGWVARAAVHVVEQRPVWAAVVLLFLVPAVTLACRRGHRRFSAARLARRTGEALEEATATALTALESEQPATARATVDGGAVPTGTTRATGPTGVTDTDEASAVAPADVAETVVLPRAEAEPLGTTGTLDHDALSPVEFEQLIAALCARDGCPQVEVAGGAGDLGADVVALSPDGRRIVIQCKRYGDDNKVGSQDLQRFGGTCFTVHEADVAVFVTTSDFTVPAREYAEQCGIVCVGGPELREWSDGSSAAPWTAVADEADA
jgi:restriction system protein